MPKAKLKSSLFKNRFILAIFAIGFASIGTYAIINSKADVTNVYTSQDKYNITYGDKVVLGVRTDGGQYCQFNAGDSAPAGAIYNVGTWQYREAYPKLSTTYSIQCFGTSAGGGGSGITKAYSKIVVVPQANISIAPSTVNKGSSTRITLSTAGAKTCSWAKGDGLNGQTWSNMDTSPSQWRDVIPSATQSYEAWCQGPSGDGVSAQPIPAYVTVNNPTTPPGTPPVLHGFSANPSTVSPGSPTTLSWGGVQNASNCWVGNADGSWLKSVGYTGSSTSTPAVTKPTTFSIGCTSANGGPMASLSVGVTLKTIITDPKEPAKPCPSGYTGVQPSCKKVSVSKPPKVVARAPSAPTNSADKERPSVPENFKAEQLGASEVDLSWDASTDSAGIAGYTLERSSDQAEWTMLDDAITDTTYTDSTADFDTAYSYRLSAKDNSGNFSDYAVVDITTNTFEANVKADEDSTITSDDGIVEVNFPAGALSEDAFCEISKDSVSGAPKGYKLVAGGYTISCRNAAGDSITEFDKDLEVTMHLKSYVKKYKTFAAYGVDGNSFSPIQSSFDAGSGDLTFKLSDLQTFAAFGAKKGSAWWIWLIIPLLLIGLFLLIRRLRSGGGGSDDYYDTTDYVGMPPNAPAGPLDTGAGYGQHTSLPDLVSQGQQPQYPQYPEQPGPPPQQPGPGQGPNQQPPQYPQ